MKPIGKKNVIRLAVYGAVLLLAALGGAIAKGAFASTMPAETFRILSDAFLIPGVVLAGVAGLNWAASKGAYDSLRYLLYNFGLHTIWVSKPEKYRHFDSLYDYKTEKDKKGRKWFPEMLYAGLFGILVAGVFLLLWGITSF